MDIPKSVRFSILLPAVALVDAVVLGEALELAADDEGDAESLPVADGTGAAEEAGAFCVPLSSWL